MPDARDRRLLEVRRLLTEAQRLIDELSGVPEYRACLECGHDFEVPRPERRKRLFCSNACRNRAWRRTKGA